LSRAMEPHGIRLGVEWMAPIVAVRNGPAGVIIQTEGLQEFASRLDALHAACAGGKGK
jgi:hypothetical protein